MKTRQMREAKLESTIQLDDYEVNIEANPDRWRGGFVWSVSLGDEEVECGLEISRRLAQQNARKCVINLLGSD